MSAKTFPASREQQIHSIQDKGTLSLRNTHNNHKHSNNSRNNDLVKNESNTTEKIKHFIFMQCVIYHLYAKIQFIISDF